MSLVVRARARTQFESEPILESNGVASNLVEASEEAIEDEQLAAPSEVDAGC
jgi:hypothetical protein